MDRAIIRHLREKHNLEVSEETAETIKRALGSAMPNPNGGTFEADGRNLITRLPTRLRVTSAEIQAALAPVAFSLISDYFRKDKRGTAVGVYGIGGFGGIGLSYLIGGAVLATFRGVDTVLAERIEPFVAASVAPLLKPLPSPRATLRRFLETHMRNIAANPWMPRLMTREVLSEGGSLRVEVLRDAGATVLRVESMASEPLRSSPGTGYGEDSSRSRFGLLYGKRVDFDSGRIGERGQESAVHGGLRRDKDNTGHTQDAVRMALERRVPEILGIVLLTDEEAGVRLGIDGEGERERDLDRLAVRPTRLTFEIEGVIAADPRRLERGAVCACVMAFEHQHREAFVPREEFLARAAE